MNWLKLKIEKWLGLIEDRRIVNISAVGTSEVLADIQEELEGLLKRLENVEEYVKSKKRSV